jgi:hypothetical protein
MAKRSRRQIRKEKSQIANLQTSYDRWVSCWQELLLGEPFPAEAKACCECVAAAHPDDWLILVPAGIPPLIILRVVATKLGELGCGFTPRWYEGHRDGDGWSEFTITSVRRRFEGAYGLRIASHREAADDVNALARAKGRYAFNVNEGPPGILLVEYALMFYFARVFGGDFLDRASWTVCADGPGRSRSWAAGFHDNRLVVTHVSCDFRQGLYSGRQVAPDQEFGIFPGLR